MSVNRAYMTSLWTTGILVASSIFVLAFTSALVAFNRWPGAAAGASIDHVTVAPSASAVQKVIARPQITARPARHPAATAAHVGTHTTAPSPPSGRAPSTTLSTTPAPPAPTGSASPGAGSSGQPSTSDPGPGPGPSRPKSTPLGDVIRQAGSTIGSGISPASPQASMLVQASADQGADSVDSASQTGLPPAY